MLNLKKIQTFLQNRLRLNKLSFKKVSQKLDPEIVNRAFTQNDPEAMNMVADTVIRLVNSAISRLGIRGKYGYDVMQDFRSQTLTKLFDYSLERFDPSRGQLSTFVFNHVNNEWKNFQNRLIRQLQRERSIEEKVTGEEGEGLTLGELIEDPRTLDFISAQEAAEMYEELRAGLTDPRYQEVFRLWVDDTALNEELEQLDLPGTTEARNAQQKAEDIAKVIQSKFPEAAIGPVRVNRIIHDIVKEQVRKKFPEEAAWAESTFVPQVGEMVETPEEEYIPLEERPSPIYRIDPQTGERTRIALNLRRRKVQPASVKYAHDVWFNTLMTWLRVELNGKLR